MMGMRTRLELKKMKEYDKPDVHQYEVIPAPKSPAAKPPVPLPPVPMPPVEHIELQEIELVEPVEEPSVAQRDTGGRKMPHRRVLDRRNVPRGTNGGPTVRSGHSPRIPSKVAPVKEPLPSLGLLPAATASGAARLGARSLWLRDEDYSAETARNGARSGTDAARHVARSGTEAALYGAWTGTDGARHVARSGPDSARHGARSGPDSARHGPRSGPDSARYGPRSLWLRDTDYSTDSSYAFDNEGESDTDED